MHQMLLANAWDKLAHTDMSRRLESATTKLLLAEEEMHDVRPPFDVSHLDIKRALYLRYTTDAAVLSCVVAALVASENELVSWHRQHNPCYAPLNLSRLNGIAGPSVTDCIQRVYDRNQSSSNNSWRKLGGVDEVKAVFYSTLRGVRRIEQAWSRHKKPPV